MADDDQNTLPIEAKMRKPEGIDEEAEVRNLPGTSVKSPEPYLAPDQNAEVKDEDNQD